MLLVSTGVFLSGLARVTIISALNIFYVTARGRKQTDDTMAKQQLKRASSAVVEPPIFLLSLIQPVLFLAVMTVSTGWK